MPKTIRSIGEYAFAGCNALKDITCLATTPPVVYSKSSFSSYVDDIYTTATVHVPQSSITAYSNASVWDNFTHFVGISGGMQGDVDGDGKLTISDVTTLIDLLLSGSGLSNATADVDGDGFVNISDVTALIDMLLNKNWHRVSTLPIIKQTSGLIDGPLVFLVSALAFCKKYNQVITSDFVKWRDTCHCFWQKRSKTLAKPAALNSISPMAHRPTGLCGMGKEAQNGKGLVEGHIL